MTTEPTDEALAELLASMKGQLEAWDADEPRSDWWQHQRDFAEAFALLSTPTRLRSQPAPSSEEVRERIALALINEARRFSGLTLVSGLGALEPHQYRDQLRYADAVKAALGLAAGKEG